MSSSDGGMLDGWVYSILIVRFVKSFLGKGNFELEGVKRTVFLRTSPAGVSATSEEYWKPWDRT